MAGTSVAVSVPQGAPSGKVTIVTPVGTATSADSLTVVHAPAITSFSPSAATTGATLTIAGSNLGGVTDVVFTGDAHATPTAVSATSLKVTVPAGALRGVVEVVDAAGNATSANEFKVAPKIDGFTPGLGPSRGRRSR